MGGEYCFLSSDAGHDDRGYRCNAYNVSSAAACLLCFAFSLSTFFDVKDMSASKMSPRTRT